MSAIVLVDGAAGGASVHGSECVVAPWLESLPSDAVFVAPGDEIHVDAEAGFLKGHGTQLVGGRLLATLCGVVTRVNKLVSVRPLNSRYTAETGDVVVGRVTEVAGKRWKLDINSRQDAVLMLSAVTLPGNVQRRRTNVDELNMRTLFEEEDLITAEVQSFFGDGGVALHTRSAKYGRLRGGQLVQVPPLLVRRLKQHFCRLPRLGVEAVLGCNGWLWLQPVSAAEAARDEADAEADAVRDAAAAARPEEAPDMWERHAASGGPLAHEQREQVCRVAAAARCLATLMLPIHPASLADVADAAIAWAVAPRDMAGPEFMARLVQREVERRTETEGGVLAQMAE